MSLPTKLVMALHEGLETHVAVNTAAVLGLSLGGRLPHLLGADGEDASGGLHAGLNTHPVPVLTASAEQLRELHAQARTHFEVICVGFIDSARHARVYENYLAALETTPTEGLDYVGMALFGPRKTVTALTKRLPLLA